MNMKDVRNKTPFYNVPVDVNNISKSKEKCNWKIINIKIGNSYLVHQFNYFSSIKLSTISINLAVVCNWLSKMAEMQWL